ncbi:MAG: right-handed parallel beta-helix repeat-containing protein [Thermoguttaceae bacterium]|nr:right-handed parallel beta-helix repeat-containing protein [Thermoguttaceae bacterium]
MASIPKDGVKRALLIGVDDYAEFADLKYAVADVEAIRERLIGLGFKPENIVELKSTSPANLRPSQRYIRRQVDALFKAAGPNDLLFLHFSGHGFQTDGVVRFAPEDATATNDENVLDPETTISLTEIVERLTSSQAKFKWLIVDACRENPTGTRSAAANARALKNIDPRKGVLVLQSCAEGELSFEDAEAGRGLFTGRLLEAFDGKADFDGDGAMSALDVCKYVSEQTLAASKTRFNATQTPYFSGEFADFIVAEELKRHGLTREDWSQAETLYNEAIEQVREKDFEAALQKIEAALAIVADVPETEDAKKRYLERKTMIDYLVNGEQKVVKLDAPSEETNDEFGKPNKFVSNVEQLEYAVENAQDGDIIQLAKGDYELGEELVVPVETKISLVGATGQKEDVRILQPWDKTDEKKDTILHIQGGSVVKLADITLESQNCNALTMNNNDADAECEVTVARCRMSSENAALWLRRGRATITDSEFQGREGYACRLSLNSTVENCEFNGQLDISSSKEDAAELSATPPTAVVKNCKIHDGKYCGLNLFSAKKNERFVCEIVDCDIYDVAEGNGIYAGILHETETASFSCNISGCKIYNVKSAGVNISGGAQKNAQLSCKIVNCTIDDVDGNGINAANGAQVDVGNCEIDNVEGNGIYATSGAQVDVGNCVISNCRNQYFFAAVGLKVWTPQTGDATRVTASDITFESCGKGIEVNARSFCNATNVKMNDGRLGGDLEGEFTGKNITFTDVKREWEVEHANATLDGRALTTSANWQRKFQQMPATTPKRVETVAELEEAIANLQDGETIEIAKGTYEISDWLNISDYLEVAIVCETGNMEDARIVRKNGGNVFSIDNSALTLTGVTLETTDGSCVSAGSSYLTLKRCRMQNSSDSNCTILNNSHGKTVIKECEIHNRSSEGEALAVYTNKPNETHSLEAEDSDFNGRISISDLEPSLIVNCNVRGNTDDEGVYVNGDEEQAKITRCDILGCNISNCDEGVSVWDYAQVSIRNTKISNCSTGVDVTGSPADCQATGVTFTNVEDEWYLFDGGTATHNGRRVTSSY